jgi:hypothetical protein
MRVLLTSASVFESDPLRAYHVSQPDRLDPLAGKPIGILLANGY